MSAPAWRRRGLIFTHQPGIPWWASHAALPTVDREADGVRVYFSGRDHQGRSQIGSFLFDPAVPASPVSVPPHAAIGLGPLGAFDDAGVTSSCVVQHGGRKYQYYSGWSLGKSVPFYFYVGLAISDDEGRTYQRFSAAPILERNEIDPYLTASPCVIVDNGVWRMWYVSCTGWRLAAGVPIHNYHIRYAESRDGLRWERRGVVCIDYQSVAEYAIARPWVIKDGDRYRMWFSCRGERYRLGYAESQDGLSWERDDAAAGVDVAPQGWDAEMVAYACVFDLHGERYMLYNGNSYGKTGIGLAQQEKGPL